MRSCSVPSCSTAVPARLKSPVSFHEFPTHPIRRSAWISSILRHEPEHHQNWSPHRRSVICSKHFEPKDFTISTTKKHLLPNVIPSIFPNKPFKRQNSENQKPLLIQCQPLKQNQQVHTEVPSSLSQENINSQIPSPIDISPENHTKVVSTSTQTFTVEHPPMVVRQSKEDKGIQVSCLPPCCRHRSMKEVKSAKVLLTTCARQRKLIQILKERNRILKNLEIEDLSEVPGSVQNQVGAIVETARRGDKQAAFLLDQIMLFKRKERPKFSDQTLETCVNLLSKSRAGYKALLNLGVLSLPHSRALHKYLRPVETVAPRDWCGTEACEPTAQEEPMLSDLAPLLDNQNYFPNLHSSDQDHFFLPNYDTFQAPSDASYDWSHTQRSLQSEDILAELVNSILRDEGESLCLDPDPT